MELVWKALGCAALIESARQSFGLGFGSQRWTRNLKQPCIFNQLWQPRAAALRHRWRSKSGRPPPPGLEQQDAMFEGSWPTKV